MRFLVDAQLPRDLSLFFNESGHDSIHTLDLPAQNLTSDEAVTTIADSQGRVVVTKDTDFLDSWLLRRGPQKLLLVTTGNISNLRLLTLFSTHLTALCDFLSRYSVIELSSDQIIVHG